MRQREALLLAAALAAVGCSRRPSGGAGEPLPAPPPGRDPFDIGGTEPDPHTHVGFTTDKDLVEVRVHVTVRSYAPEGLSFFALQVNFTGNHTWAHGGFQTEKSPAGKVPGWVNWCGLVSRGGGSADYKLADLPHDLDSIQCDGDGAYAWRPGVTYEYAVARAGKVAFPPGDYSLKPTDKKKVTLDHARSMWEWRFTIRPLSAPGPTYEGRVYDSAETLASFVVWNENGAGSTREELMTTWSDVTYRTAAEPKVERRPSRWTRR